MEVITNLKRYWVELIVVIILVLLPLLYSLIPFYAVIIGYSIPLIIFLLKSIKDKLLKKKKYDIILNIIEEILKDIHSLRYAKLITKRIYEKFDNLEKNFKEDLKELHCFIENVEGSKAIVIYIDEEKIVAIPEKPILRKSETIEQSLKDFKDIESLIAEIRKKI